VKNKWEFREVDVMAAIGVDQKTLRAVRNELVEGTDWQLAGRTVTYTREGLKNALRGLTGYEVEIPAVMERLKASTPDTRPRTRRERAVFRRAWRNPRLIEAEILSTHEVVQVVVRDNRNFRACQPPMTFDAIQVNGAWSLEGRSPRWPGRW
jgi:hypothetical protein